MARASGRSLTTPRRPRSGTPPRMRANPARYVLRIFEHLVLCVLVGGYKRMRQQHRIWTPWTRRWSDHGRAMRKRHDTSDITHEARSNMNNRDQRRGDIIVIAHSTDYDTQHNFNKLGRRQNTMWNWNGLETKMDAIFIKAFVQQLTSSSRTGSQVHPLVAAPPHPAAWYHPDPAGWSLPRQACRSPQDPRPGCSARHWPLQDQRRAPAQGQLPIRHRHLQEG